MAAAASPIGMGRLIPPKTFQVSNMDSWWTSGAGFDQF
jgi:hypothetical protein